jgi:hypothetical protein
MAAAIVAAGMAVAAGTVGAGITIDSIIRQLC